MVIAKYSQFPLPTFTASERNSDTSHRNLLQSSGTGIRIGKAYCQILWKI